MFPLLLKKPFRTIIDGTYIIGFLSPMDSSFYKADSTIYDLFSKRSYRNEEEVFAQLAEHSTGSINYALQLVNKHSALFLAKSSNQIQLTQHYTVSVLTLNMTYACNFACEYCFEGESTRSYSSMNESTAELAIVWFLNQLGDKGGKIIFTGGEPLLNFKVIKKVVHLTKCNNISYLIKTNGSLITDKVLEYLVTNDIELSLSLDGNKYVNDKHRKQKNGVGSYDEIYKVLETVRTIYPAYINRIYVNAVVTNETINYIAKSDEFLTSLSLSGYSIKPVMHQDLNLDKIGIEEYVSKYYWPALMKQSNGTNVKICGIGHKQVCVDWDGTIYPCYRLCGQKEYIIGSIYDENSYLQKNPQLEKIYQRESSNQCENCYAKTVCVSGCYADKLNYENCYEDPSVFIFDGIIKYDLLHDNKYKLLPLLS